MRLLNRTALITGANNPYGIGAAVARIMTAEGAQIALTYRRIEPLRRTDHAAFGPSFYETNQADGADEVVTSLTDMGGTAVALEVDLALPGAAARLFDWAEAALGPVEILVNCAAHFESAGDSILNLSEAGIDQTLAINIKAMLLLSREFLLRHRKRHASYGRIVNFSTDGARCFPGQIVYGASKAAIESLTRSMAKEVISTGVTVNAVAPGPVQTGYIDPESAKKIGAELIDKRVGLAAEVADAVLHFVLPSSSWTTGQVLYVAGGHDL